MHHTSSSALSKFTNYYTFYSDKFARLVVPTNPQIHSNLYLYVIQGLLGHRRRSVRDHLHQSSQLFNPSALTTFFASL